MRIVCDQRFVVKPDGKRILQCKYLKHVGMDMSGCINGLVSTKSDWEDVPICDEDSTDE